MMRQKLHERIEVLYEDIDLIVINKASGVITYPVEEHSSGSAIQLIRRYWKHQNVRNTQLYLIHRLDLETSGLLVFAKTSLGREALKSQFDQHSVVRSYIAVTDGLPAKDSDKIKTLLGRDQSGRRSVAELGKLAVTKMRVLQRNLQTRRALVRCTLETGRTHQIRVHLAHIGTPVLGDRVYRRKEQWKHRHGDQRQLRKPHHSQSSRLALHADTIGFRHPRTKLPMLLKISAPPEFAEMMR